MFSPGKTKYIDAQSLDRTMVSPSKTKKIKSIFDDLSMSQFEELGLKTPQSPLKTPSTQKNIEKIDQMRQSQINVTNDDVTDETAISMRKTLDAISNVFRGTCEKNDETSSEDFENEISALGETFAMAEKFRQTKLSKSDDLSSLVTTPITTAPPLKSKDQEQRDHNEVGVSLPSRVEDEFQGDFGGLDDDPYPKSPEILTKKKENFVDTDVNKTNIRSERITVLKNPPEVRKAPKSEFKRPAPVSRTPLKRVLSFDDVPDINPTKKEKRSVKDLERTIKFEDTLSEQPSMVPLLATPDRYIDPRIKVVRISDFEGDFLQFVGQKIVKREETEIIEIEERRGKLVDIEESDEDDPSIKKTKSGRKVKPPSEFWKAQ